MTEPRHERLKAIFAEACGLDDETRSRRLDELCAGDDSLRREVESLLGHDAEPAIDFDATSIVVSDSPDDVPSHIGEYRVLGVLGRGGMGIVYHAEQQNPKRRIALKLIRPGLGHSDALRRFQHEAELLGRLQHPGIAKVFEVGTAEIAGSNQPYLPVKILKKSK